MAIFREHLIVRKRTTGEYNCKCGWIGDLNGVPEHMVKNQPDLTRNTTAS